MASESVIERGVVQSLIRANGRWLAVVTAFRSKHREPVISKLIPLDELRGSAKRKADRWARELEA